MNRTMTLSMTLLALTFLGGCTDPGETTQIGAATGGVVGASLGAMIGNQTGDTGSGLVVGALAGSATGAAIGNSLEAQAKIVRSQDEAIERQERQVQAQRTEIEELRRASNDSVSYRGQSTNRNLRQGVESSAEVNRGQMTDYGSTSPRAAIRETDLGGTVAGQVVVQPRANSNRDEIVRELTQPGPTRAIGSVDNDDLNLRRSESLNRSAIATSALSASTASTPDCVKALGEVRTAEQATENADKLFRYRRALRLCPSEPSFHNGLGEVYLALNRKVDAEFEFKEALSLDSGYSRATNNLKALQGNS